MDIHPVIMAAGRGSRLAPLTNKCDKCLLPIANVPMLWYPLRALDLAGFRDVTILVLNSREAAVKAALQSMQDKVPWKTKGFNYTFERVPDIEDEGTYTSLMKVAAPRKDLLVLGCDVVTSIPLESLIEQHKLMNSSLTCLFKQKAKPEGPVPGVKSKSVAAKDSAVVAVYEEEDRLVHIGSQADHSMLPLSMEVLEKYPNMLVTSLLEDCHLYLISQSVLSGLKSMASLEFEVIPKLVDNQFAPESKNSKESQTTEEGQLMDCLSKLTVDTMYYYSSKSQCSSGDTMHVYAKPQPKCSMYRADNSKLCYRVSTLTDFYELNRQVCAFDQFFDLGDYHKNPSGFKRSQLAADSTVGAELQMADKSCIKKSAIGRNCQIGDNVKINNCIIMDNAIIKDGSVLQTCIICEGATIGERSELKECIIGAKQVVEAKSKMANEVVADDDYPEL